MNSKRRVMSRCAFIFGAIAGLVLLTLFLGNTDTTQASDSKLDKSNPEALQNAFEEAAKEFHVPKEILMSVSYNETRWNHHDGEPSTSGGYGIMHLTQVDLALNSDAKGDGSNQAAEDTEVASNLQTLNQAATLLDLDPEVLKVDQIENIRGGAALLAHYAEKTMGEIPDQATDWYGTVAKYNGFDNEVLATDFADRVYATIQEGAERTVNGQHVILDSKNVKPNKEATGSLNLQLSTNNHDDIDCPPGLNCEFIPAAYEQYSDSDGDYGNYDLAERPDDGLDIRYIVIHDIEGSYESAVNWFQDQSYVSAHYVIRSSDGKIAEMVKPEDAAWQAGNWYFNAHSIGIEHEGYAVDGATWYSETMYQASAELVKYLADRYDVPLNREHIIGHDNVPGLTPTAQTGMHWDPGTYWDWGHYLDLLGANDEDEPRYEGEPWEVNGVVAIQPDFEDNQPLVTYQGEELESQPANFVYLRTDPEADAPLIGDRALHPNGEEGTTDINDWGNKAVTGQHFYRVDRDGDWSAIDYAGEKAWFYDPHGKNSKLTKGMVITPKKGKDSIPVYGASYPEDAAYEGTGIGESERGKVQPLQYDILEGQKYVADGPFLSDYYYSKRYDRLSENQVVKGNDEYYQISFNHRLAFVKKSDVDIVTNSVDDIEATVTNFDEMGEFDSNQVVRKIERHLEAVGHYEQTHQTKKVIKHLKGLKNLLEYEEGMMSSNAYETLESMTETLIDMKEMSLEE